MGVSSSPTIGHRTVKAVLPCGLITTGIVDDEGLRFAYVAWVKNKQVAKVTDRFWIVKES